MRYLMALLVPLVLLAIYNARAGGENAGTSTTAAPGRYEMEQTKDGFVRIDTQTGEISLCQPKNVGWACEAVPDDRAALEDEIRRLDEENQALREQLTKLAENGASDDEEGNKLVIELPTKKDIQDGVDNAGEFLDHVMERFQSMIKAMKKELSDRS